MDMPISAMSMQLLASSRLISEGFRVVITKSTVPVGTADEVERIIREAAPDAEHRSACRTRNFSEKGRRSEI